MRENYGNLRNSPRCCLSYPFLPFCLEVLTEQPSTGCSVKSENTPTYMLRLTGFNKDAEHVGCLKVFFIEI